MFFFDESLETFEMFSTSHLLAVLFWIAAITVMVVFRRRIREIPRLDRFIRLFLAIAMLIMQLIYYVWVFWRGDASLELLPFGLCHLSMYMTAFTLLTQSRIVYKIVFPWAIIGALLSLAIADMTFEFPHFRYIHYFGLHGMFLFGVIYLAVVRGFDITYRSLWLSGLILLGLAVPVFFFNRAFGTNHLFLSRLPGPAAVVQDFLGAWWHVGYVGFVTVLFHLIYGVFRLLRGGRPARS